MIVLFTDYGLEGPYTGQVKAVIHRDAPGLPVFDLFADLPPFDSQAAAYLLAAYAASFPLGCVFLCVIDPGVGSDRAAVALEADGRWFVGPDNGVFEFVIRRAATPAAGWRLTYAPDRVSATFHGRDIFAPVAAAIAVGAPIAGERNDDIIRFPEWPDDLAEIVYIDRFGNAITGCRAGSIAGNATLIAGGRKILRAKTFSSVQKGEAFWYENSNGMAEIALNGGRADAALGISVGSSFIIEGNVTDATTAGRKDG
jgi:Uncharacterized conserved protein